MGAAAGNKLAGVMGEVARDLEGSTDVDDTIAMITRLVCETVPGVDYAGIMIGHRGGRRETLAPTDWSPRSTPRYAPRATELGIVSQMGFPLFARSDTLGGLSIYSTQQGSLDTEAQFVGDLFATHAGIALGRARKESQLTDAVSTRKAIGQALGITMELAREIVQQANAQAGDIASAAHETL